MPIQRAGETPPFVELPLRFIVSDSTLAPPPQAVTGLNPLPIAIPSFQRGIEWGEDRLEQLLDSSAVLYGTVILGSFPGRAQTLIDGLQRFATTTALIDVLYSRVLQPNPSHQGAAPFFQRLKARVAYFHPVVDFNVQALGAHKRRVISRSFLRLYGEVEDFVEEEIGQGRSRELGERVERMMLDRQVAIDPYYNFQSISEMTGTFVNLNTAGVSLSHIDLVRSRIVDQASVVGWNPADVARMEDRYTDVFESPSAKPHLRALAKAVDAIMRESATVGCLFPNWGALNQSEVDSFIDFVDGSITAGQMGNTGYLRELFQCSPSIFALTALYYYRDSMQAGSSPAFLPTGVRIVDPALHLLLRAAYRRVIDGTVFRVGDMIQNLIGAHALPTMSAVAAAVNPQTTAGSLGSAVDSGWLCQRLRETSGNNARRVFNACLLPDRAAAGGPYGPAEYGRRTNQFSIDHLIPSSQVPANDPAEPASDTILNFAPLVTQYNRQASSTPCSTKLGPGGVYSRQRTTHAVAHPYLEWLMQVHFPAHAAAPTDLDEPARLLGIGSDSIGEERIQELARQLSARL